jgi:hypothetical protein
VTVGEGGVRETVAEKRQSVVMPRDRSIRFPRGESQRCHPQAALGACSPGSLPVISHRLDPIRKLLGREGAGGHHREGRLTDASLALPLTTSIDAAHHDAARNRSRPPSCQPPGAIRTGRPPGGAGFRTDRPWTGSAFQRGPFRHRGVGQGHVRPPDECAAGAGPIQRHRGHLFLVADGMGGHQAGEVASALSVVTIEGFH